MIERLPAAGPLD